MAAILLNHKHLIYLVCLLLSDVIITISHDNTSAFQSVNYESPPVYALALYLHHKQVYKITIP